MRIHSGTIPHEAEPGETREPFEKLRAVYQLGEKPFDTIYSRELRKCFDRELAIAEGPVIQRSNWREHTDRLKDAEIILSGWGMEPLAGEFLEALPNLKLVLYSAGSVRGVFKPPAIERGIRVCSSWQANAVPVAEFTYATILLALKRVFALYDHLRQNREWRRPFSLPGAFGSTVGLVSFGAIGRRVARFLQSHDLRVIAYDPFIDPGLASELGVELVPLETVFSQADVVSIHTPHLDATRGMINGDLIASMKEGACLINTARGQVIREDEMARVLGDRPDLTAHLDVVAEEPLAAESPLWTLPNVYITPHIAGSVDRECERMGWYMYHELRRYMKGEPLQHEVTPELLERMA